MLLERRAEEVQWCTCRVVQLDGAQAGGEEGSCVADVGVRPEAQPVVLPNSQHGVVPGLEVILVQAQHLLQLLHALRHLLSPQNEVLELLHCSMHRQSRTTASTEQCGYWPDEQMRPARHCVIGLLMAMQVLLLGNILCRWLWTMEPHG